jgi:hypothetical protein
LRFGMTAPGIFQPGEPTAPPVWGGINVASSLPSSRRYVRASAWGKAPLFFTRAALAPIRSRVA